MERKLGARNGRMWIFISMWGEIVDHLGTREGVDESSIRSSTDFLSLLFSRSYMPRYEGPSEPLAFIRILKSSTQSAF